MRKGNRRAAARKVAAASAWEACSDDEYGADGKAAFAAAMEADVVQVGNVHSGATDALACLGLTAAQSPVIVSSLSSSIHLASARWWGWAAGSHFASIFKIKTQTITALGMFCVHEITAHAPFVQVMEMGFSRRKARDALAEAGGSVEGAINFLLAACT